MNSKFWFALCLIFLFYNLKQLLDDRRATTFYVVETDDVLFNNQTNFSLCISFSEIKKNGKRMADEAKLEKVNVSSFISRSIESIEGGLNLTSKLFDLDRSYLFNGHVCFLVDKLELENRLRPFISIYQVILFVFSYSKNPFFYEYVHLKQSINRYDSILLRIHKRKIYDEHFLASPSECIRNKDQLNLNRFICLNNCFKEVKKSKKNFYSVGDEGEFNLSLIIDDGSEHQQQTGAAIYETPKNLGDNLAGSIDIIKGAEERYKRCFTKCPVQECFWETYQTVKVRHFYYEKFLNASKTEHISLETTIYQAVYSMDNFHFGVQLFGLITLLTGTSLIRTLPIFLNRLLKRALKRVCRPPVNYNCNKYFKLIRPKISFALILFGVAFLAEQSFQMLAEFHFKSAYPNRTSVLNFSSELRPVDLILCFPIETVIHKDATVKEGRNLEILKNKTFAEIENETRDGFNIGVRSLTLRIGSKRTSLHYSVSQQTLFKHTSFNETVHVLARCFQIPLAIQMMKFKSIAPIINLVVTFHHSFWEVFLKESSLNFSSDLNSFKGEYKINLNFIEHSASSKKANCVDYSKRSISKEAGYFKNFSFIDSFELKCDKRQACLDHCYNKVYLEKHRILPRNTFFDEQQFNRSSIENVGFNSKPGDDTDDEIKRLCSAEFPNVDCKRVIYHEAFKTTFSYDDLKISINLNFEKATFKDTESSFAKTLLNIHNFEAIIFGSNATSLFLTCFALLRRTLGIKWHKSYKLVLFFVCTLGFSIHNYLIFREIISGKLVATGFFRKLESFTLPNTIFCFDYTDAVDENHRLTSGYLDQLTSDLVYEKIFEKIVYYNKSHVNTFIPSTDQSSNSEIQLFYWYFLDMRCIEIQVSFKLEEKHFYFTNAKNIITIYFHKAFANQRQRVYFLYKYNGSLQFSGLFSYKIGNLSTRPLDYRKYDIVFEMFDIVSEDKFEVLKNLKRLFLNSNQINHPTSYLRGMKQAFKTKYNLTTREIMLEQEDFGLEIDSSGLFEQYYRQVQNASDNDDTASLNFELKLYNLYVQENFDSEDGADFNYAISLASRQVRITNEDNYIMLIQSLLNTTSLWFDRCILDLAVYLDKLTLLVHFFYKHLVYLRARLKLTY